MAEARTIANALRLAKGCAVDARDLAAVGSRDAAYFAEQAVEQIRRVYATATRVHIPRSDSHLLDKVVRSFSADLLEKDAMAQLAWLQSFPTTYRYTTSSGRILDPPDPRELDEAIEQIFALIDRAVVEFGVDLEDDSKPAAKTRPATKP